MSAGEVHADALLGAPFHQAQRPVLTGVRQQLRCCWPRVAAVAASASHAVAPAVLRANSWREHMDIDARWNVHCD